MVQSLFRFELGALEFIFILLYFTNQK